MASAAWASPEPAGKMQVQVHKADSPALGIDERLGEVIPSDITLYSEDGRVVTLGSLITGPTVLVLAYYRCTNLCTTVLDSTASLLGNTRLEPGKDFSVITVSFNELETPEEASAKRRDYTRAVGRDFPVDGWRFLTGSKAEIKRLTDAVGFRFKRDGEDFLHPSALIVVSKDARIARYLYGSSFLPFDLEMAVVEASRGSSGPSIKKALLFCFSYDPEGRRYVFNALRVTGTVVLFSAGVMIMLVTRRSRRGRPGGGDAG